MSNNNNQNLLLKDKFSYGIGNLGVGVAMQVVGTYLVFFSTAILGISGSLVGIAVGFSVFWDAITDPVMGYISDITRSKRFGRRHLYLIIGALGVALTITSMWIIPSTLNSNFKFFLLFIDIILLKHSLQFMLRHIQHLGLSFLRIIMNELLFKVLKQSFFY